MLKHALHNLNLPLTRCHPAVFLRAEKRRVISNVSSRFQPAFCQSLRTHAYYFIITVTPKIPRIASKETERSSSKQTSPSTLLLYFLPSCMQRWQCHPILTVLTFLRPLFTDQEKKSLPKITVFSQDQKSCILHWYCDCRQLVSTEHSVFFFSKWWEIWHEHMKW